MVIEWRWKPDSEYQFQVVEWHCQRKTRVLWEVESEVL